MLRAQAAEVGELAARNEPEALKEYLSLGEGRRVPARCRGGLMYFEGRGTAKDDCQAKYWLQQVVEGEPTLAPLANARLEKIAQDKTCAAPMVRLKSINTSSFPRG